MKFKIKTVKKAYSFQATPKGLFCCVHGIINEIKYGIINHLNENFKISWQFDCHESGILFFVDDKLFFNSNFDSKTIILQCDNGSELFNSGSISLALTNGVKNNLFLVYTTNIEKMIPQYGVYDYSVGKVVWQNENYTNLKFISNFLLHFDNWSDKPNELLKIDEKSGEIIWKHNISSQKLYQIYGVYNENAIILGETDLGNYRNQFDLIAIDIENGKQKWILQKCNYGLTNAKPTATNTLFSAYFEITGGIDGRSQKRHNKFVEIDLINGVVLRNGFIPELDKEELEIVRYIIKDGLIYFMANYQGAGAPEAIGILDYETLELIWWQVVDFVEGGFLVGDLQVEGNRIYVKDNGDYLYIFEKEQIDYPF